MMFDEIDDSRVCVWDVNYEEDGEKSEDFLVGSGSLAETSVLIHHNPLFLATGGVVVSVGWVG